MDTVPACRPCERQLVVDVDAVLGFLAACLFQGSAQAGEGSVALHEVCPLFGMFKVDDMYVQLRVAQVHLPTDEDVYFRRAVVLQQVLYQVLAGGSCATDD